MKFLEGEKAKKMEQQFKGMKKKLNLWYFYCVVIKNFLAPLSGYKHGFMVSKVWRFYFKILEIFFFEFRLLKKGNFPNFPINFFFHRAKTRHRK
jgi:hypothetical protein